MALPQLTAADVEAIVPNCKVVAPSLGGGQKLYTLAASTDTDAL